VSPGRAAHLNIAAAASELLLFAFDVRETAPLSACQSTHHKINHAAGLADVRQFTLAEISSGADDDPLPQSDYRYLGLELDRSATLGVNETVTSLRPRQ
jgi:hypothetical protein